MKPNDSKVYSLSEIVLYTDCSLVPRPYRRSDFDCENLMIANCKCFWSSQSIGDLSIFNYTVQPSLLLDLLFDLTSPQCELCNQNPVLWYSQFFNVAYIEKIGEPGGWGYMHRLGPLGDKYVVSQQVGTFAFGGGVVFIFSQCHTL